MELEERLENKIYPEHILNQLLLVYGSLATKGNQEIEYRVMDQLVGAALKYHNSTTNYPMTIIIIALGNSGSNLSISPLLSFLNSSSNNGEEEKVPKVINALAKVTIDKVVLSELDKLLQSDPSVSIISAVLETLQNGLDYEKARRVNLERYSVTLRNHNLLKTLARIVSTHNDSDIYTMTVAYFTEINASQEIWNILHSKQPGVLRQKRYTTDWDSHNSDYDYVASRASRFSDEKDYPTHHAYLNSKTIGINDANLKLVFGLFAGRYQCKRVKVFGRIIAVGKILWHRRTVADAKVDLRLRPTQGNGTLTTYVKFGSNTLLNTINTKKLSNNCWKMTENLIKTKQLLYSFRLRFFVYVGTLSLHVRLYFQFNLNLNGNLCLDRTGNTVSGALGAISPSAGLTIEGGITGNLLVRVQIM